MKLPTHNTSPDYVRSLIESCGISQREAARLLGVAPRTVRYWLAPVGNTGMDIPYECQLKLEYLALLETTKSI